jgi:2'-5' RNA ligase
MKRLFAAIELHPDKAFADTLSEFKTRLMRERITWVSGHNLHLTLKFFGATAEENIPAITKAMQQGVRAVPPFDICFNRTGIFGSSYNPKVIWLGADPNPALEQLFAQLKTELEKTGFVYDRQNFVPHLTIGRIRGIADKALFQKTMDDFRQAFSLEQKIDALQLYESVLSPNGPLYTSHYTAILKQ